MSAPDSTSPVLTTRVLHLTDLHFSRVVWNPLLLLNKRIIGNANLLLRRRRSFLTHQAGAFMEYIAGLGVRDVIITGDFTSTSTDVEFGFAREFMEELDRRGLQTAVFAGNHDVYTFESVRRKRFEDYLGKWELHTGKIARLSNGFPVVFVPTVCPNLLSSRGRILPSELEAVRAVLNACSGPLLIAGHYPVLAKTYGYSTKPSRRLREAETLAAVLREYRDAALYIAGHVHRFSFVRDSVSASLLHLTSGSLFRGDKTAGQTGDFSEIRVSLDGFHVARHRYQGEWIRTEESPRPASG